MDTQRFVNITRNSTVTEREFYPAIDEMYKAIWESLFPVQIPTKGLSNKIITNVITPAGTPVPDCLSCGACCASLLCVGIRPGEEPAREDHWDIFAEDGEGELVVDRYVKRNPETLACIALEGELGSRVGCRIYESRPTMCRDFEAGSDRCHAIRRAYGLEPFLTIEGMLEANRRLDEAVGDGPAKERFQAAKIERDAETGELVIRGLLPNGTLVEIHRFDERFETWRQFEFDGLTAEQAADLVRSRSASAGPHER